MKILLLLLFCSVLFWNCSDAPNHTDQVENKTDAPISMEVLTPIDQDIETYPEQDREDLDSEVISNQMDLAFSQYPNLKKEAFFASYINEALYFFTIKGPFETSFWGSKQNKNDKGSYLCGLVNAKNEVIIPTHFDKIYNMGGVAPDLIEVELDGKLGAYDINGKELLKAEFDAIYPYRGTDDIWVQVRKGDQYGWLRKDGQLFLDKTSHKDPNLFKAQTTPELIRTWGFDSQSPTFHPIFTIKEEYLDGVIVMPSYLFHLGIVPEYQARWQYNEGGEGLEYSAAEVLDSKASEEGGGTFLTTFSQTFMDARGYSNTYKEAVTVNDKMEKVDYLKMKENEQIRECDSEIKFKLIDNNLIEVCQPIASNYENYDSYMTAYSYYNISADGEISPSHIDGDFPFTRALKINEEYFKGCFTRAMTEEEKAQAEEDPEIEPYFHVNLEHLSINDLDIMRNEIFAAHGYKFKNKQWQTYFKSKSWYRPQFDNVDDQLSDIELHNINVILDMKSKMTGNEADYIKKGYDFTPASG